MTKILTEQWREGKLESGMYYWQLPNDETFMATLYKMDEYKQTKDASKIICLAPVPSYDKVKEMSQKIERLEFDNEALEMAYNEGKEINAELVSKTDELVQKIHILNEQNTKQYNELCDEIKKNNILEKKLKIAKKALNDILNDGDDYWDKDKAQEALTKMKGVK